jgi:hypothetical protein
MIEEPRTAQASAEANLQGSEENRSSKGPNVTSHASDDGTVKTVEHNQINIMTPIATSVRVNL